MLYFYEFSFDAFAFGYDLWFFGVFVNFLYEFIDEIFNVIVFSMFGKMFSKLFFFILVGFFEFFF